MSTHKKPTDQSTNGLAQDIPFMSTARKVTENVTPQYQGYIALGLGAFLFLFSIGYFAFIKTAIGFIGLALIAWGLYASHLIGTITGWVKKFTKKS
jgi:hypothetical protein